MKVILFVLLIFPFISFCQLTESDIRRMAKTAGEPELIIESSSLILEKKYFLAEIIIDRLLEIDSNSANYNYRKGLLLLNSNLDYLQAKTYFLKALPLANIEYDFFSITDSTCSNDVYFYLANCYHLEEQIDKAKEYYTIVINLYDKTLNIVKNATRNLMQCDVAKRLLETPKKTKINNVGSIINSKHPDYAPVISLDGQALYFTSRRPWKYGETEKFKDPILNNYPEDIYVSYKDSKSENGWTTPEKLSFCEKERNEATIAISPDERLIYVYQDNIGAGDIFYSDFSSNSFQQVKPLELKNVNSKYWETHCTMTIDGLNMYFVSNRPGGFGGRDIYRIVKLPDGNWSEPKNLGPTINTEFDEDAPFIGADNKTLYFSSNGPESMGGFDLFLSLRDEYNNWSLPVNLGYPINSTGDDIFFTTTIDGKRAYFTSFRIGGIGEKDIYEIQNDELGVKNIAVFRGLIKTAFNKPLPSNISISVKCIDCTDKSEKTTYVKQRDGSFFQTLEPCKTYETSYINNNESKVFFKETFSTSCESDYDEIYRELILDADNIRFVKEIDTVGVNYDEFKLREGEKIEIKISESEIREVNFGSDLSNIISINPIYFDLNKSKIRSDAALELDKIVKILNDNPTINLELGSHTDCRDTEKYNLNLSSSRAENSSDYIKKRIVNPNRITSKGYGESKLKNDCKCEGDVKSTCSEEEHQLNRRTEFIILKKK
jgi:outer membrane protein OmpA-like peptidoglycan-associated protein/tetratricopeptide (TPR) repeat protein